MSGPTAASVAWARRGGSGPEGRPSGTEQTGCTEQTAAGRAPPWGQSLCLASSVAPPATGSPWPDARGSSVTSLSLPCRPSGPGLLSCPRVCLLLAEPPPCRPPQGGPCSSPTLDSASSLPSVHWPLRSAALSQTRQNEKEGSQWPLTTPGAGVPAPLLEGLVSHPWHTPPPEDPVSPTQRLVFIALPSPLLWGVGLAGKAGSLGETEGEESVCL